jgi:putative ABC transport system permease protein
VNVDLIHTLREWLSRAWQTLRPDRSDRELEQELRFHMELVSDEGRRRGLDSAEALRRARLQIGGTAQAMEALRDQRGVPWLDNLLRDVSFATRLLIRTPAFTSVAILTLGLTIGACTAIYSVVYAIVLRPLPYPSSGQIVQLHQVDAAGRGGDQFSDPNFEDLRDESTSFRAMAEFSVGAVSAVAGGEPLRAVASTVSRGFFDVFGVDPLRGRPFSIEETRTGGPRAAVVSERLWRDRFGDDDSDLVNARLRINGQSYAIVGVMPRAFSFPPDVDVWMPRELDRRNPFRTGQNWQVVARLRNGVALESARREATAIARKLKTRYGQDTLMSDVSVQPLYDELVGRVRPVLLLLQASVILLLSVACANLANLLLARTSARRRELAVRAALGGTWMRLVLPLAAESLIVSACGGVLGVAIAATAVRFSDVIRSANLPHVGEVRVNWSVVLFAAGLTSLTAVALAMLAGWRERRLDVVSSLKDARRGHTNGIGLGRLRSGLIVAQLVVSVVLVIGAGLLGRSLTALLREDLGFRTDGRVAIDVSSSAPAMHITPDGVRFDDPSRLPAQARLNQQIIERLAALPGINHVGGVSRLPLSGGGSIGLFAVVSTRETPADLQSLAALAKDPTAGEAAFRVASAGYFRVMGIPLIRGRLFDDRDTAEAPHVALVSESLARARWPGRDPIGEYIQFGGVDGDLRVFTIVGIVGDVRERGFDAPPQPAIYADYRQRPLSTFAFTFVARTAVAPAVMIREARRVIRDLAPEVPPRFRMVSDVVDTSVAGRWFAFALTAFFASVGVLIAMLGLYGVLAFLVAEGAHEFSIRMALGARRLDIQRLVLGRAARVVIVGLALGTGLSLVATRLLSTVLFHVRPADPATYVAAAVVLVAASLAACEVPAIRATRSDPARALRADA